MISQGEIWWADSPPPFVGRGVQKAKVIRCIFDGGGTVDANEFNATAVRTEDLTTITFDVRPFGDRQGDAIDSYLHQRLMMLQMNAGGFGPRLVVLLCDSTANMPNSAGNWLNELNARGVATEIRRS